MTLLIIITITAIIATGCIGLAEDLLMREKITTKTAIRIMIAGSITTVILIVALITLTIPG